MNLETSLFTVDSVILLVLGKSGVYIFLTNISPIFRSTLPPPLQMMGMFYFGEVIHFRVKIRVRWKFNVYVRRKKSLNF